MKVCTGMHLLAAAFIIIAASSCLRERLYDDRSDYRIEISTDYDMKYGRPDIGPGLFRCCFFDVDTGMMVSSSIVGGSGGYLYNLAPGVYDVLVYDYSSDRTKVSGDKSIESVMASTTSLMFRQQPVVETPDHLFTQMIRSVEVPYLSERDPEFVLRCSPRSCIESWLLEVDGIRGLQNAEGIDVYVTGQSRALYFGRDSDRLDVTGCSVWFQASADLGRGVISTPFNTFGKLEGEQARLVLNLYIQGVGGESYICRADVTDQFDDSANTDHIIRASFDLEIQERRDGGMNPHADPWDPSVEIVDLT